MGDGAAPTVTVEIHARSYTFAATEGQTQEHIRAVAALVDERMAQVQRDMRPQSQLHTAILAALHMIDELWCLQEDYDQAEAVIDQRASKLADTLGRIFQESAASSHQD